MSVYNVFTTSSITWSPKSESHFSIPICTGLSCLCPVNPLYPFNDKIMNSRQKMLLHRCKTLLPLFLFFSTTHDQLLKMIIDAENDLEKTRDSLCPQQGGLLKLHNCPLIYCLLEREALHPLLLILYIYFAFHFRVSDKYVQVSSSINCHLQERKVTLKIKAAGYGLNFT